MPIPHEYLRQVPRVVLQAPVGDTLAWLSLGSPVEILQAETLDEVRPVLRQVEARAAEGLVAAGFVSYEASPAFDPVYKVHLPGSLPLAWFGVFEDWDTLARLPADSPGHPDLSWSASTGPADYEKDIQAIHRYIAQGETYQVNFTMRLTAAFAGDPWTLFTSLCHGQQSRCCAYVDTGSSVLCSASPELFFRLEGEKIWSRPMKGTAPRGRTSAEDAKQEGWLQSSGKNRAENIMIVDMVRNDLGRVAVPETVRVSKLCHLERYPSLFQLTSTVEARTRAPLEAIFEALFPCASVTGAPKIRSMEIIRDLERGPRGAYTGAIGLVGPGRRARFNVGIRTAEISATAEGRVVYGTGSGVVWESKAKEEWQECHTKALVLRPPPPDFALLETMLWSPSQGIVLLERHLYRLADSARYFDYPFAADSVRQALDRATAPLPQQPHRVRLLLDAAGTIQVESERLGINPRSWRLAVAADPVSSKDPFLFHKTTHRQVYQSHRDQFPNHDDVLLWNEKGEITESTVANVVVFRQQRWITPPLDCGLLAGTLRADLLEKGKILEEPLGLDDLPSVEKICLINSVRQWIPTELDASTLPLKPIHPNWRRNQ